MKIRLPFAGLFLFLLLLAGYAGLTSLQVNTLINDKLLHLTTFLLLTLAFYWILDTNRRRTLNLTLLICTLALGVGSEVLQALLPNGRDFDLFDVVANVVGSLLGLAICSWYHKRMLERRRMRKQYNAVPGEDVDGVEEDLELGEGIGIERSSGEGGHEEGVIVSSPTVATAAKTPDATGVVDAQRKITLEQEVDNWDEHADDDAWDEDDGDIGASTGPRKSRDVEAKRAD